MSYEAMGQWKKRQRIMLQLPLWVVRRILYLLWLLVVGKACELFTVAASSIYTH
jgi:hypothetical protein